MQSFDSTPESYISSHSYGIKQIHHNIIQQQNAIGI